MIHKKSEFEYMDVMTAVVNWGAYLLTVVFLVLALTISPMYYIGLCIAGPLALLSIRDRVQKKHSILRNYPIMGHLRFIFESIRPEMMQYFIETDTDGRPFNRNERTVVYERAKSCLLYTSPSPRDRG